MTVPVFARYVFFALGLLLVVIDGNSVVGTLIVPRQAGGRLMVWVDRVNHAWFGLVTSPIADFRRRDRVLAAEAAVLLICQLLVWLGVAYLGFTLMLWPFVHGGFTEALDTAGPALWFIGDSSVHGWGERLIQYAAAFFGLVTVTLQIAYLPTLYSAFNRRETDIALLNAPGGRAVLGPGTAGPDALRAGLRAVHHRHPARPLRAVGALGRRHRGKPHHVPAAGPVPLAPAAVLLGDRAAIGARFGRDVPGGVPGGRAHRAGPAVPAQRLPVLRRHRPHAGYDGAPGARRSMGISLTYDDFLKGIAHLRKVDFPIERDPADAWPDFLGWRVNYEQAAYAVARAVDAVPALWSGPRRHPVEQMAPFRPLPGRPGGYHPAKGRLAKGRSSRNHRTADHRAEDHQPPEHPAKKHAAKDHPATDHLAAGDPPAQDAPQPGQNVTQPSPPATDNPPA